MCNPNNKDILEPIPDTDLPALADLYRKYAGIPHIYRVLKTLIKWKESKKTRNLVNIYSPNNSWKKDGSFVLLMEFGYNDIIVFTFDITKDALLKGLMETKRINFNKNWRFHYIDPFHYQMIFDFIRKRHLKVISKSLHNLYSMEKEVALKLTYKIPPEVYIKKLDKLAALDIAVFNSKPSIYHLADMQRYYNILIKQNGGYGLYSRTTNMLIAWALKTTEGQIGILQILDEYQNKGYGSLLVKIMCKEIAENDEEPLGIIRDKNKSAIKLLNKLTFNELGSYIRIDVKALTPSL